VIKEFSGKHRWLSNFWMCPVVLDGVIYPTVENAYQAAKTTGDRTPFINCSPGKAKRLGRKLEVTQGWDIKKTEVMFNLLNQKFQVGTFNSFLLLETGSDEIIEGNTWGDVFWGVCEDQGENNLGKMIMQIRDSLEGVYE